MNRIQMVLLGIVVLLVAFSALIYIKGTDVLMDASKSSSQNTAGVSLDIDDFSLNPLTGTLGITGLAIGQPPGFGDDNSFSIDNFLVDIKPLSLFDNHIKVETVFIEAPTINLVIIDDESNFELIQNKLEEELGKDTEPTNINMSIQDFYLTKTLIKITSEQYGNHEVTLADIHLKNIGVEEGGVPPKDILRHIMDVVKPQIGKLLLEIGIKTKLSNALDQGISDQLKEQLENVPDELKNALDLLKPRKED